MNKLLIVGALVISFILFAGCCGSTANSSNNGGTKTPVQETAKSNEPLNAEVRFQIDANGMTATVTNRNAYTWTNLTIIADDYYPCQLSPSTTLEPNAQAYVILCMENGKPPLTGFSKLNVKTDQGEEVYMR